MSLEYEDTIGMNQSTDFTGQGQALTEPVPSSIQTDSQPDRTSTVQDMDVSEIIRKLSLPQQLMAKKIGLFGNQSLAKDAAGRPVYNAFTEPYKAAGGSGASQEATGPGEEFNLRPPLKQQLGFDPDKIMVETGNKQGVSYEPTSNERLTRAFQYNVRGNKTAEEHSEAIKAPFKPVGEVMDGYFSLPVDDPKEYDLKTGLWEFGRRVGRMTPLWDSGRQYGQLTTDIQRRDMRGEAVSDEERMRSAMYRNDRLWDAGRTVVAGGLGLLGKMKKAF
ncbi:MAG: hypothetical protein ACLGSA_14675 [Acidobacteriota bacterium]